MKLFLTLVALFALTAGGLAQDDSSNASRLADKFGDAFTQGSLKKAGDYVADRATVYWVNGRFGKAALGKMLQGELSTYSKHTLAFNQEGSAEDENLSTSWGAFLMETGGGNAVSNFVHGRYSLVAQKKDGKWQILSLHLSVSYPRYEGDSK